MSNEITKLQNKLSIYEDLLHRAYNLLEDNEDTRFLRQDIEFQLFCAGDYED